MSVNWNQNYSNCLSNLHSLATLLLGGCFFCKYCTTNYLGTGAVGSFMFNWFPPFVFYLFGLPNNQILAMPLLYVPCKIQSVLHKLQRIVICSLVEFWAGKYSGIARVLPNTKNRDITTCSSTSINHPKGNNSATGHFGIELKTESISLQNITSYLLIRQDSHALKKTFSLLFQHLFNTKWKNLTTMTYRYFSKIFFMEHNTKNTCKTVISGKEKN